MRRARPSLGRPLLLACTISLPLVAALALPASGGDRFPYGVAVQVDYGEPEGPNRLRREIELELIGELERAGCFDTVVDLHGDQPPRTDLLLRITLDGLEDRMNFESSIAQRTSPNAVPQEEARRVVAELEMDVRVELLVLPEGVPLRTREFHEARSHRPLVSEDPRVEVRDRVVRDLARSARAVACKGSQKKLARQIAEARAPVR